MPRSDLWWVYLLRCQGARYYIGMSQDLEARVDQHRLGHGALFSRQHPFECLVGAVPVGTRRQAGCFERKCKRWSPERKREFFSLYPFQDEIPLPSDCNRSEVMTKLWNALAMDVMAIEQKQKAEAAVWEALQAQAPDLCVAISYLITDESQAARWVCHPNPDYESSPAYLVARGQSDVVMAMVLRSLHGIG